MNEILDFLKNSIAKMYGKDPATLNADTRFVEDLGMASVDIVRITAVLENEYEVEVPYMGFKRNKTIGEAGTYISELTGIC